MFRHRPALLAALALAFSLGGAGCGLFPGRGPASEPAPSINAAASGSAAPAAAPAAVPVAVGAVGEGLTVTGTVGGQPLRPQAALASPTADAAGSPALMIMISDQADACGLLSAQAGRQGSAYMLIALGAGGVAPGPGLYTVGDAAHEAVAQLYRLDASCQDSLGATVARAVAGTVQIDIVGAANAVSGRFTLSMGSQRDVLTGTFQASGCAPLQTFIDPTAGTAAMKTCG